ncbi:hypothetical protein Plhal304r1_c020g0072621 [Plasmopara halstedii]
MAPHHVERIVDRSIQRSNMGLSLREVMRIHIGNIALAIMTRSLDIPYPREETGSLSTTHYQLSSGDHLYCKFETWSVFIRAAHEDHEGY